MCIKGIRKRYAEITISPSILKGSVNMKENGFKKVKSVSCFLDFFSNCEYKRPMHFTYS